MPRSRVSGVRPGGSSLTFRLCAVDLVHLVALGLLVGAGLVASLDGWLVAVDIALMMLIAGSAIGPLAWRPTPKATIARLVMSYFVVLVVFNQLDIVIPAINPVRYDSMLLQLDRDFLHFDLSDSLSFLFYPVLSDLLSVTYLSFFSIPLVFFLVLYRQRRFLRLAAGNATVILGFYLSFIGNLLVPAASPFRTLPEAAARAGMWLYGPLNSLVDRFELHQLSAFPSGHILVMAIVALLAAKWCRRQLPIFLVWGALLWLSTVYLGYHYLIDTLAAVMLAPYCLWAGLSLSRRLDGPHRTGQVTPP